MVWECEQGGRRTLALLSGLVVSHVCVCGGVAMTQGDCPRSSVLRGIAGCLQSRKVKTMFRKDFDNVVGDRADNGP